MADEYFKMPLLGTIGCPEDSDYVQELQRQLVLAEAWDVEAQYRVGQILTEGLGGVPVDLIEATKWVDLAARKYHRGAALILRALIDSCGWDLVGEGKRRAFRWQQERYNTESGRPLEAPDEVLSFIKRDAWQGTGLAFGIKLNDGKGYPADYEKSVRFFRFGAERDGCMECSYRVGNALYHGKGVKADPVQAIDWLKPAAGLGHAGAAILLGLMAARGHGLPRDNSTALDFLRQAEKAGDPDAAMLIRAVNDGVTIF